MMTVAGNAAAVGQSSRAEQALAGVVEGVVVALRRAAGVRLIATWGRCGEWVEHGLPDREGGGGQVCGEFARAVSVGAQGGAAAALVVALGGEHAVGVEGGGDTPGEGGQLQWVEGLRVVHQAGFDCGGVVGLHGGGQ